MKSNATSPDENESYPASIVRPLLRFFSTHLFGNMLFFLDETPDSCAPMGEFDPEKSPPWIIHREDLLAINALYKRIVKEMHSVEMPEKDCEKSEGFLIFVGGCIVSKVIILIHYLLLSYNYYKIRTVSFPGLTISAYLNPEIVPDLKEALVFSYYVIFANPERHPYLRTAILSELYAVMKILFDVMNGMLPCEEVARLREAYDDFHLSRGKDNTFAAFFTQLRAVSRRFAAEEPKWERERAESPYTEPMPVIDNAAGFAPLASAGRRPRKRVPVKVAAAIFETHPNTIGNWDKGHGRPPEYLGRNVDESLLRIAAERYFLRRQNETRTKRNFAEGLTHRSVDPKNAYGRDSALRVRDNGNYFVGTANGKRKPSF